MSAFQPILLYKKNERCNTTSARHSHVHSTSLTTTSVIYTRRSDTSSCHLAYHCNTHTFTITRHMGKGNKPIIYKISNWRHWAAATVKQPLWCLRLNSGVDKGGPSTPPNGRAKKNFFAFLDENFLTRIKFLDRLKFSGIMGAQKVQFCHCIPQNWWFFNPKNLHFWAELPPQHCHDMSDMPLGTLPVIFIHVGLFLISATQQCERRSFT